MDGPYLWYRSLRRALEELGFVCCPFDSCLFALITEGPDKRPQVHGVLGDHVDDGIGGDDEYFILPFNPRTSLGKI